MTPCRWCAIVLLVAVGVLFTSCEGPQGPTGPAGPPGQDGDDGTDFETHTYLGDNADKCGHCHSGKVEQWEMTGHPEAYDLLASAGSDNNPYCLHCHTTGWDSEVSYGDSTITQFGPNVDGFDDAWAAGDTERMQKLESVQCEACHGAMGPTIYEHEPKVSFASRMENGEALSLCSPCHETQLEHYYESGHGMAVANAGGVEEFTAEWGRSSCAACHASEGFIAANDPDHAGMPLPEEISEVGCVTCHDPHDATNELQLRNLNDYAVLYDANYPATFTGYGSAQLCVQCHHARRDVANVEGQIANGSAHLGPHASAQMDMFLGTGCYEIEGFDYEYGRFGGDGHFHQSISEACVTCHMPQEDTGHGLYADHSFEANISACTGCHAGATDFNVNGFQDEIAAKMATIVSLIGVSEDDLGNPDLTTPEQRMAAYAYEFVSYDGSMGIHNPKYAERLLDNAIASLQ